MSRVIFLLLIMASIAVSAAEVFRWVDDDGVVHYSDRPAEGAEVITIPNAQTFSTPPRRDMQRNQPSTTGAQAAAQQPELFSYRSFEIVSPGQQEILWNTGGELNVALSARPRIQATHTIFLYLDGEEVQQLARGRMQASLSDVFRGEHTLRADVKDANGNRVAQTESSFTVQQTSIQNPNNPNVAPR
ncbi:MAG: DUF4124 domain-containing protein [Gammaproteobacteria bacterium]|nr:MAG: DUF4124 domain-containing protein [Gammaproteobacteria bacterium]